MRGMRTAELALLIAALVAPGPAAPLDPIAPAPAAEKLAQGDRATAAGDLRGALFAYQDAAYLSPASCAARVKLGRAYLALGYPAQARAQAEQALTLDAGSADARRLLDDAREGRVPAAAAGALPAASPATAPAVTAAPPPDSSPRSQPHVYRLTPAPPVPAASLAVAPPARAAPVVLAAAASPVPVIPVVQVAAAPLAPQVPVVQAAAAPARSPTAADRYRAGVQHIVNREFMRAIVELDRAIQQDERLGAAYAARASARFGLGLHREAAQDYASALELDPGLATPLFGLAECYRRAGDPRAADLYQRYAASGAADVREDFRTLAVKRAEELAHQKGAIPLSSR